MVWKMSEFYKRKFTPQEALAHVEAALPDAVFARRYGIEPELIKRLAASRNPSAPASEEEVLALLRQGRDVLPRAWPGGVPEGLLGMVDRTIAESVADDAAPSPSL